MRRLLAFVLGAAGLTAVSLLACYNPGDLGDGPFRCYGGREACPDGYQCELKMGPMQNYCVRATGGGGGGNMNTLMIPKTGMYPSKYNPSGLMAGACGDEALEPNNSLQAAQAKPFLIDQQLVSNAAICPADDVDVYGVNLVNQYVKVTLKYQIQYGDLDVAVYDSAGKLVPGLIDADAGKNDACIVSGGPVGSAMSNTFYVVVAGAKNALGEAAINRYTLKVETPNSRPSCSPVDMAEPPDLSEE